MNDCVNRKLRKVIYFPSLQVGESVIYSYYILREKRRCGREKHYILYVTRDSDICKEGFYVCDKKRWDRGTVQC